MANLVDELKVQHGEIGKILSKLEAQLAGGSVNPAVVASDLNTLKATVVSHIKKEDAELYPKMNEIAQRSNNTLLINSTTTFSKTMAQITQSAVAFFEKYANKDSIAANPGAFAADAKKIVDAVRRRMSNEETSLYPLYVKHCLAATA